MHNLFIKKIEEYNTITIFRHLNPDFDALGAQFGLKQWILDNYPTKNVYCLGQDKMDNNFHPNSDEISDEKIKESLAIVLDCSDNDRVDDNRFLISAELFRVDHHPGANPDFTYEIVDTCAASTCELLTELFIETQNEFSLKTAIYIYRGIIADTISFKTNNTTAKTLKLASFVASKGVKIAEANLDVFDITKQEYLNANYIRNNALYDREGLAYIIIDKKERERLGLLARQVKEYVTEFHGVKEFKIWAVFVENEDGIYEGSIRSKNVTINDIANKYHGGGHKNACGVKKLTLSDVNNLLDELQERIDQ